LFSTRERFDTLRHVLEKEKVSVEELARELNLSKGFCFSIPQNPLEGRTAEKRRQKVCR